MNQAEIIAMAKEAGVSEMGLNLDGSIHLLGLFERFAALVAAKEREACAEIAEKEDVASTDDPFGVQSCIADAIRARGTKEGA